MADPGAAGFVLPDGYDFLAFLGAGGGGWVVRARHRSLDREVAIKAVPVGGDAGGAVQRLVREGRVLARLQHPGVVRVQQLIPGPATVFLVMELLAGASLQDVLADGPLPPDQALAVLRDVAAALTAVHAVGVVHRDVKPGNIVVHPDRGAVLLDFGLARLPAARAGFRSEVGVPTGTPRYMAPEQLLRPQEESPAIDAYAFGVLAYRLLLGRDPYRPADTLAAVVAAHLHERPVDPRTSRPDLPGPAALALLGALEKDPQRRVGPAELMRRLAEVPESGWRPVGTSDPASPPTAAATATGTGPSMTETGGGAELLVTSGNARGPVAQAPSVGGVAVDTGSLGWIQPAVYRPARGRRRRQRTWLIVAGALVVGLAAGAVLAWLWSR